MTDDILSVGVMGFSGQKFNEKRALAALQLAFDMIKKEYPDREIGIVSGLTNLGVPALAYAEAVRRGWKTVGIACSKANNYECFPCDDVVIVGENWGEESQTFLDKCEVFVRVGGGDQTFEETGRAKAQGKPVYEYDLDALPS